MVESSYYIDRTRSIRKSVVIYEKIGGWSFPIMYIQKPKWITEEEFENYLDRIVIMITEPKDNT